MESLKSESLRTPLKTSRESEIVEKNKSLLLELGIIQKRPRTDEQGPQKCLMKNTDTANETN
jgi:hypothetical protein